MKTDSVTLADLRGVFSVPPLARSNNRQRSIDFNQNALIIRHIASGGIRRFLYGGNALLYHLTEDEYAELLESGNCVAIKYAVVRPDPLHDSYLEGLLKRVDRNRVISGMGERPALVHLRDWQLPGLTTGSGCVAPHLCNAMYDACAQHDYAAAKALRWDFMPLEDLRDMWGPARVLHFALKLAGIANTGPLPPYLSELSADQAEKVATVARALLKRDRMESDTLADLGTKNSERLASQTSD